MLNNSIKVIYILSTEIMADGLTKALQGTAFKAFIEQIGLVDVKDQLEERGLREVSAEQFDEEVQGQIEQMKVFRSS